MHFGTDDVILEQKLRLRVLIEKIDEKNNSQNDIAATLVLMRRTPRLKTRGLNHFKSY